MQQKILYSAQKLGMGQNSTIIIICWDGRLSKSHQTSSSSRHNQLMGNIQLAVLHQLMVADRGELGGIPRGQWEVEGEARGAPVPR